MHFIYRKMFGFGFEKLILPATWTIIILINNKIVCNGKRRRSEFNVWRMANDTIKLNSFNPKLSVLNANLSSKNARYIQNICWMLKWFARHETRVQFFLTHFIFLPFYWFSSANFSFTCVIFIHAFIDPIPIFISTFIYISWLQGPHSYTLHVRIKYTQWDSFSRLQFPYLFLTSLILLIAIERERKYILWFLVLWSG